MNQNAFIKVGKTTFYDFVARHDDQRFEYEDGRIVQQMTGGTRKHGRLALRFYDQLRSSLDRDRFEILLDRGVETATTVRYPDVVVESAAGSDTSLATLQPILIVEVLSPSSTARDLDRKPAEYTGIATLEAYIVASQDEAACLLWLRQPDARFAAGPTEISGENAAIGIPQLNLAIPLAELYRGIDLSARKD
ncbi:MAG: Uma2 family endonuclease [Hyphomicrobiaceae bacterium]|nr:Uma2 family endonuclease [Hyphomicrobiaceae bacterium]